MAVTRYQPTLDIWAIKEEDRKALHPGQWVTAGEAKGRYLGQRPGGSDVVLWRYPRGQHNDKLRALRAYAKSGSALMSEA
jgi:hypothetical protein